MGIDSGRIVTLTTDFGQKDPYVGVVKGVILSRFPQASIVDLNHEIPPFDIIAGAWSLKISVPYFKSGSIHIAVVDPAVGSQQRRIALLWTLAEELFRDRLAVALYLPPDGNPQPGTLALLRGVDPKVLLQLRQRLEPFLTLMDEQIELSDTPTGAKVVSVNGKAYVALGNSWIAFANTRELLMKSLGLISGKSQGALADDVVFQVSTTELGDGHLKQRRMLNPVDDRAQPGDLNVGDGA